jgi:hypothetical protein
MIKGDRALQRLPRITKARIVAVGVVRQTVTDFGDLFPNLLGVTIRHLLQRRLCQLER